MTQFRDVSAAHRFEQGFTNPDGATGIVWADYSAHEDHCAILHVEADHQLRGSGAAGQFMASLADHARVEGIKLTPRCSYAVAWFRRHPDQSDLLA